MQGQQTGVLEVEIRGILEDDEYDIEIVSEKTETILSGTKYVYDSTLMEGEEAIKAIRSKWGKEYNIQSSKEKWKNIIKNSTFRR